LVHGSLHACHHLPLSAIQRGFRKYQAQARFKAERNWVIFQASEYHEEVSMLNLCRFFDKLSSLARTSATSLRSPSVASMLRPNSPFRRGSDSNAPTPASLRTEDESWDAVYEHSDLFQHKQIASPLDITLVHLLLASSARGTPIDAEVVIAIIKAAAKAMWYMPNIRHASTKAAGKVTVTGKEEELSVLSLC
jgi:hypothetical protein